MSMVDIMNAAIVDPGDSEPLYPGYVEECRCISHGNEMLSVEGEVLHPTGGKTSPNELPRLEVYGPLA